MTEKEYAKHQERAAARTEREIASRVAKFDLLPSEELQAKLKGATPWERQAIRRVLARRA